MRRKAGYNSPRSMALIKRICLLLAVLAGTAFAATPWDVPVAELAAKVVAITGPGTASFTLVNASSFPADQVPTIRKQLQEKLRASGIQLRDTANATFDIRVTLSENYTGWLWVAEVAQGADTRAAMVAVDRPASVSKAAKPALTLRRTYLISSEESLLDAAIIHVGNDAYLAALSGASIALYRRNGAAWELQQAFPVTERPAVFPRDLRGRIVTGSERLFDAYLPGVVCSSGNAAPVTVACHASDDPWSVGGRSAFYNSARNYFTGVLVPPVNKQLSPFYTVGELPRPNYTLLIYTGIDGLAYGFDGIAQRALSGTRDWGSELAVLRSSCGSGVQILATAAREDEGRDSLHVYEMADREASEVGAPLVFDGEIVALWPASDGTATVVVRRTEKGNYDAYSVAVACNQ